MNIKTYKELSRLATFEERYTYLRLEGVVGKDTFGFDRYLNQLFYHSDQWKSVRNQVIIRDNGCDLGMPDREIQGRILIHHMNPITIRDLELESPYLLDPNYLICVSHSTHNAIHYGDENQLITLPKERTPNDTCPWKNRRRVK